MKRIGGKIMELSERKLRILQAIISDYIMSAEPVGSRTLSKKFQLGISPATIRNEMSDLEELGYLTHPHTSAGRVPSDKAYRLYVNNLMERHELSEREKEIIEEKLRANVDEFDKTIRHAAKLLSEITNLTSFAMTPTQDQDTLKFVNFLPVDESTIVLMIVSESGKVSNTTLHINEPYLEENLQILAKNITYNFKGMRLSEVLRDDIIATFEQDMAAMNKLPSNIMPNFIKTLEDMLNVNLYMDGMTNIFDLPEYSDIERAKSFLKLFDEKESLTKKIMEREDGIIVTIGDENEEGPLSDCSLITATYHIDGKLVGKIGVIGPTRMKYDEITSVIEYLTDNLSDTFKLEKE